MVIWRLNMFGFGLPGNPIIRLILPRIIDRVADALDKGEDPKVAVAKEAEAIEQDPVVINETNQEPWYKSRVVWGFVAGGLIFALERFGLNAMGVTTNEIVDVIMAGTGFGALAYGLWNRLTSKPKAPLFTKS